jgi:hypothetical protein
MTFDELGREIVRIIRETGQGLYVTSDEGGIVLVLANEQPDDDNITLLARVDLGKPKNATVQKEPRAGKRIRTADMLLGKQADSDKNQHS